MHAPVSTLASHLPQPASTGVSRKPSCMKAAIKDRDSIVSQCFSMGSRLSILSSSTRLTSEDLEVLEIEKQKEEKQVSLCKHKEYF